MSLFQIKQFEDETKYASSLMIFSMLPLSKEEEEEGENIFIYVHILRRR